MATGIDTNSSIVTKPIDHHPATLSIDNSVYQQSNIKDINNVSPTTNLSSEKLEENINMSTIENGSSFQDHTINNDDETLNKIEDSEHNLSNENIINKNESEVTSLLNNEEKVFDSLDALENDEEKNTLDTLEQENKPSVRKLSLFDTLNESSNNSSESTVSEEVINKSEPTLDNENDLEDESEQNTDPINIESDDTSSDEVLSDEDFNQEQDEELLDIPTFLRRQAN